MYERIVERFNLHSKTSKNQDLIAPLPEKQNEKKRLCSILDRVQSNRLGKTLVKQVQQMIDRNELVLTMSFDSGLGSAHGNVLKTIENGKTHASVFLNPERTERFLAAVLAHELRHVLQKSTPAVYPGMPYAAYFVREFALMRFNEGDAFTHQILYAIEAERAGNNATRLQDTINYLTFSMPEPNVIALEKICDDLIKTQEPKDFIKGAEEIFWLIQPQVAQMYDQRLLKNFDARMCQRVVFEDFKQSASFLNNRSSAPPCTINNTLTGASSVEEWFKWTPDTLSVAYLNDTLSDDKCLKNGTYLNISGSSMIEKFLHTVSSKNQSHLNRIFARLNELEHSDKISLPRGKKQESYSPSPRC